MMANQKKLLILTLTLGITLGQTLTDSKQKKSLALENENLPSATDLQPSAT